eukprot:1658587-Ditylum_brightwellii.AAC.1
MSSLGSDIEGADCIFVTSGSSNNTSTSNMLPVDAGIPVAAGGIAISSGSNSSGRISRLTRSSFHWQGQIDAGMQQQYSTITKQQHSLKNSCTPFKKHH